MAIQAFGMTVSNSAKEPNKGDSQPFGQTVSSINPSNKSADTKMSLKQTANAAILQASLDVSLSSGNQSMALLFKAAIEGINDLLEPSMGPNAIQNGFESGIDVSPEATAGRIVSMSTAFFAAYQEQHPEMGTDEALTSFASLISGGINQGFKEAREILNGLQVLSGDIATNIDQTYQLVQEGLKSFTTQDSTV